MNKWVKNEIVKSGAPTIRARLDVVHGGGQIVEILIPACKWVQVKNGGWMQVETLNRIGIVFGAAAVSWLDDCVILSSEKYCYRLTTRPKSRLTTKSKKGEDYGQ